MNKRNEMRKARMIVAASCTAFGPLPAERVLRDHFATIVGWRNQGASWDQIAKILCDAGWRSNSGGIISAQVIRAMSSRIQRSHPVRATSAGIVTRLDTIASTARDMPANRAQVGNRASTPTSAEIAERMRRAVALRSGKDDY